MTLDVRLDGAQRLTQTLRAAADAIADTTDVNQAVGDHALGVATIPHGASGRLDDGAHAEADAIGVVLYSDAAYWTFVHFGAPERGIPARPFFTDALRDSADAAAALYLDHAQSALDLIEGA